MSFSTIKTKVQSLYNLSTVEIAKLNETLYRMALHSDFRPVLLQDTFKDYLNRPEVGIPTITNIAEYASDDDYIVLETSENHKLTDGQLVEILTPSEYAGTYTVYVDDEENYPKIFRIEKDFDATAATTGIYYDMIKEALDFVFAVFFGGRLIKTLKRLHIDNVAPDFQQYGEGNVSPARTRELVNLQKMYLEDVKNILASYNTDRRYSRRLQNIGNL